MKSSLHKIIHFGITPETSAEDRIKIRGINFLCLTLITILLLIILVESFNPQRSFPFLLLITFFIVFIGFIFSLNLRRRYRTTHNFIVFVAPVGIFTEIILFGNSYRADSVFLVLFVAGIFLHSKPLTLIASYLLYTFLLVSSQVYLHFNLPIFESQPFIITEYAAFIITTLSLIFIVMNYENEKTREDKKREDLLQALALKNQELISVNKDLEDFAYATSHDLKTPIRTMVSFTDLLKKKRHSLNDETALEYINFINQSSRQMYHLVENLLSYAKIGIDEGSPEWVDLNLLVKQLNIQFLHDYPNFKLVIPRRLPTLFAHASHLTVLFYNLVENGIKYNQSREFIIQIRCHYKGERVFFEIEDNGIGIEPAYEKYIFEIFKRLHTSSAYTGSGIGLATCQRIMQKQNGSISFTSTLGVGTTFSMSWPLPPENIQQIQKEVLK